MPSQPPTLPQPTTAAPPLTAIPTVPISVPIEIVGDVVVLPGQTIQINIDPIGNEGGYIKVNGCVAVQGTLDVTVMSQPTSGQNITFLESPCISYNGTGIVTITANTNQGCDKARHAYTLFACTRRTTRRTEKTHTHNTHTQAFAHLTSGARPGGLHRQHATRRSLLRGQVRLL